MRLVLLMSVSCLWAGASALSFGRANPSPDEDDNEGSLLRGRNLNTFLTALRYDYDIKAPESEAILECPWSPDTPETPDVPSPDKPGSGSKGSKSSSSSKGSKSGSGSKGSKSGSGSKGSKSGSGSKGSKSGSGSKGSKSGSGSKGSKSGSGSKGSKSGSGSKGSKSGGSPGIPEVPVPTDDTPEVPENCPCRPEDAYVDDCPAGQECCPDESGEYGYCVPKGECEPDIPVLPTMTPVVPPEIPPPPTTAPVEPPEIPPPPTTAPVVPPEIPPPPTNAPVEPPEIPPPPTNAPVVPPEIPPPPTNAPVEPPTTAPVVPPEIPPPPTNAPVEPPEIPPPPTNAPVEPPTTAPVVPPEIPPPPPTNAPVEPPEIIPPPTSAPVECPEIDCGELDEPCCIPGVDINVTDSTSKCFDGLVCNSPSPELGICIECGDLGEPCCEGNAGNDLCAVNLVCVDDDGSPTGQTCEVPPIVECPECPVCPTPEIPPEIPPTTFCIPTGQPCENFEECCDSDQCEPGGTCCNNAFNPCVNGTIFDNEDVCCGERACVVPPDGEDVCCGLLGEGDEISGCQISDDRCCGGLVCGVEVDAIVGLIPPDFPLPSANNTCCVPPLDLIPPDIAEEKFPKCRPSYKSLNFLLDKINTGNNELGFTIEDWNGCCDPSDLCNSLGQCVKCIEVGDFGCTSTPEACCGGIMEDPAVDCAASGGPNTEDGPYPEPSNRCCVKNGREGCEVTRVSSVDDPLCCQFENGFTCTDNICCLPLYNEGRIGFQQDCFGDDDNCCGDLVCVDRRCASPP